MFNLKGRGKLGFKIRFPHPPLLVQGNLDSRDRMGREEDGAGAFYISSNPEKRKGVGKNE